MKQIRAALLGLGKIGLGYDLTDPVGIKTHAKALLADKRFELVMGIDPGADARGQFENFSHKKAYSTLEDIPDNLSSSIDLLVMATPSHTRLRDTEASLKKFKNVKYIILEKPVALTVAEAEQLPLMFHEKMVFVNYMRRCNPHFIHLRERIKKGEWGSLLKIDLTYPDTVINMGSHFIDLINFFFDLDFNVVKASQFTPKANNDFSIEAELKADNVKFFLYPSEEKKLEMHFFFEKSLVKILNSGRKIQIGDEMIEVDLSNYQKDALNHVADIIFNGRDPYSDFNTAKKALVICEKLRRFQAL